MNIFFPKGKKATQRCRCGSAGADGYACRRGPRCARDYQARISGPFMDRMDLHIEVPAVTAADLSLPAASEGTREVARRVRVARDIQAERAQAEGAEEGAQVNAELPTAALERLAAPDEAGRQLLSRAAQGMGLTARGYHRVLRIARTIADLDGGGGVRRLHIAEALGLRRASARADETAIPAAAVKIS